jgi:hypothetical protein
VVGTFETLLGDRITAYRVEWASKTYDISIEALNLRAFLIRAPETCVVAHDCKCTADKAATVFCTNPSYTADSFQASNVMVPSQDTASNSATQRWRYCSALNGKGGMYGLRKFEVETRAVIRKIAAARVRTHLSASKLAARPAIVRKLGSDYYISRPTHLTNFLGPWQFFVLLLFPQG